MTFEEVACIEEKDKMRRSDSGLNEIVDFESVLLIPGHVLQFFEVFQPVVEQTSRDAGIPLIVTSNNLGQQFLHPETHFGADEYQRVTM